MAVNSVESGILRAMVMGSMFEWFKKGSRKRREGGGEPAQAIAPTAVDPVRLGASFLEQGNALLGQDRFEEAAHCYEQAAALNAQDAKAFLNLGYILCELGQHAQALEPLERAASLDAHDHDAFYLLAGAREACGDLTGAIECHDNVLALQPSFELAYRDLSRLLFQSGQFGRAKSVVERAIAVHPQVADFHFFLGNLLMQDGQRAKAIAGYQQAIKLDATSAPMHRNLAAAFLGQGKFDEAVATLREAVRLEPAHAQTLSDLGHALRLQGKAVDAAAYCEQALRFDPHLAAAHNNLGVALMALQRPAEALDCFARAIQLKPDFAGAFSNRGAVLSLLGQSVEALKSHEKALAIDPASTEALNNLGNALLTLNSAAQALALFEKAVAVSPNDAGSLNHCGTALRRLGRREEALCRYDQALAIHPDHMEALNNRGSILADLGRLGEADACFMQALSVDPNYAEALFNRGNLLRNSGRPQDALESYQRALALNPDLPFLFGNWLHVKMQMCDWQGLDEQFQELARRIEGGQVLNPFTVIPTNVTARQQRLASEQYVRSEFSTEATAFGSAGPPLTPRHQRIRVGYFSADFHEHATAYLMAELFERHDHTRFELFAFSFGPDKHSAMRSRLESAFDHFLAVNSLNDHEIAHKARELEIDIAVDLKGFTQNCRPGIFSARAAPVQVSYLGYPGTMGADFIDYLVADSTLIRAVDRDCYSEKIVYLPGSYQVNDSQRSISDKALSRAEMGLPAQGFVFCCFNNSYKITPAIFSVWMRLLLQVSGSVLWLLETQPQAAANLRAEAAARGVAPERLIFAPHMNLPEHLARQRVADLFVDTIYCNAHTTASDALWAGVPVLTCAGDTFASRVAASLLSALDLEEMVVSSLSEYETKALQLAHDAIALKTIRERLEINRLEKPLFDARQFAHHIEAAYVHMHTALRSEEAPSDFFVPA